MALPFQKWQALGNDYIIVERDKLPFELTPERVRRMCAAHLGCHSDGVLELSPPGDERFVARLRIFNPDGSEAELSGNGAREAVLYLRREGWTDRDEFSIETAAGEVRPTITSPRTSRMEMGRARLRSPDFPSGGEDGRGTVTADGREFEFQHVSIGNPQCAIRVDDGLEEPGPGDDRAADRAQRAVPEPHQRVVLPGGRRRSRAGAHLRARGGGDARLGDRRIRRGRGRRAGRSRAAR